MLWAACGLAFFGFLRCGESVTSQAEYKTTHFSLDDIALDSRVQTPLANSSTCNNQEIKNPFHQGVNLFLVKTGKELCPVAAMVLYLAPRDSRLGLLFILQDGSYLTRQKFTDLFRLALREAGLDDAKYTAHNFRIGAVISAKDAGLTQCACDVEAATHTNRTCAHHRRNWHRSPNSCKLGQLMLQALSHTELAIGCIKMLTIFRSVLY